MIVNLGHPDVVSGNHTCVQRSALRLPQSTSSFVDYALRIFFMCVVRPGVVPSSRLSTTVSPGAFTMWRYLAVRTRWDDVFPRLSPKRVFVRPCYSVYIYNMCCRKSVPQRRAVESGEISPEASQIMPPLVTSAETQTSLFLGALVLSQGKSIDYGTSTCVG